MVLGSKFVVGPESTVLRATLLSKLSLYDLKEMWIIHCVLSSKRAHGNGRNCSRITMF